MGPYSWQASGTHPTGMHSCFVKVLPLNGLKSISRYRLLFYLAGSTKGIYCSSNCHLELKGN